MPMLARVEGMPLESLRVGVPWDWRTTSEYLDRLDGDLAIDLGFMVGHSAIRRLVMGPEANERAATPDELAAMQTLLRDGLAAGALGFSTTTSATHNDQFGRPVPSRFADEHEFVELARVCGEFEGTSLELLPRGATDLGPFDDGVADLMIRMSQVARRPLNWNVIQADGPDARHVARQARGRRRRTRVRRQGRRAHDASRHEGAFLVPRGLRARRVRGMGTRARAAARGAARRAARPRCAAPSRGGRGGDTDA